MAPLSVQLNTGVAFYNKHFILYVGVLPQSTYAAACLETGCNNFLKLVMYCCKSRFYGMCMLQTDVRGLI